MPDECYCVFCDSDDELTPNALELLYEEAVRSGADVVCGATQRVLKNLPIPRKNSGIFMEPRCYDHRQIMRDLYISCFGLNVLHVSMCSKLYRCEKIKKAMTSLEDHPKTFGEDLNVTLHLLPELERLSVISQVVYRYRYGGGTSRFMPTFLEDSLLMYHIKMKHAHLCTSEYDVEALIAIELKNIVGSYLVMCQKHGKFSHGSLLEEVRYVCGLEEVDDAMGRIDNDKSGIPGLGDAMRSKDYQAICELIGKRVQQTRIKDFIKKLLFR